MTPRTLFAWMFVAIIVTAGIFFTYHIAIVSNDTNDVINGYNVRNTYAFQETRSVQPKNIYHDTPITTARDEDHSVLHAEPLDMHIEPKEMPYVVGQTEADLRATRPISETPPTIEYPEPEASDPMETVVNSESEFGDNLRHPEQMIELQPPMGTLRTVAAGLGSEEASMGAHESVQYAPEMIQNGGEFMSGIFAFDGSDVSGIGYSMI